jgi:hypothetical protein
VSASQNRKMSILEVTVRNMQLENRLTPPGVNTRKIKKVKKL